MNSLQEFEMNDYTNENKKLLSAKQEAVFRAGSGKKSNQGLPGKPGNWKSLGVRPKIDPDTLEPTKAFAWENREEIRYSVLPVQNSDGEPDSSKRKAGRPIGSKNKPKKDRHPPNMSYTNAPDYTSSSSTDYYNQKSRFIGSEIEAAAQHMNGNILADINNVIQNFMVRNRTEIMEQCNWSTSTFHRKYNMTLSNADAEMIGRVTTKNFSLLTTEMIELVSRSKNSNKL
ncbi:hypothetical protein SAMN05444266_10265 [Chitinophaga jiangningensis]|uniref:Uncharacterized protein n=1 Tax=Chitinophaga jiangningensis TaxID=1419482 RepID=A0A1M6XY26_9BACT|nr:hypothetical protein [Chitinophaga jiangningensis]SHL10748.1 hypothetical protein SAMN05444266_10265 [Chitinophaga jiangningensis]